jgi:DNA-binding NarL/FixJ family response regulator
MRRENLFDILLVGRSGLLREGVASILRSAHFGPVSSLSQAEDLMPSQLAARQLLFLVIHTGGNFAAAVKQIEYLRNTRPDGRISVVTDCYQLDDLVSAFRAGVNAYFSEITTADVFIKSIELVMMGETVLPLALLSFVTNRENGGGDERRLHDSKQKLLLPKLNATSQFSPREKLILSCLIEGDSNKSIARKIEISEATVKVHVKAILRKIRVHNRTQAAIWGMNNGWPVGATNSGSPSLAPTVDIEQDVDGAH